MKIPVAGKSLHCYVRKTQMYRVNFKKNREQSIVITFNIQTGAKHQPNLNIRHRSPESVRLVFIHY